ncbi:CLOCK-interacting pacemaker-like isoform X2 [Mytilus trossulus]|uniref:CLOCK-interacting pacemaker-like isoform X2 n=1 Tax=Mytilus trossulus TaxID=6551 RepID=UPI003006E7FF
MEKDSSSSCSKEVTETSTLVNLLKNSSSGPSEPPKKKEQRADKANIQTDQADVLTCASLTTKKKSSSADYSVPVVQSQLISKPWRSSLSSNGFYPTMDQQGVSSPISSSCVASVTNTNYYTNDPIISIQSASRKHSFQQIDNFDTTTPEKIRKMSEDNMDKYSGIDIKSPPNGLKAKRYNKTAEALKMSGLMDITMKTADLLKKNKQLQTEMDNLKKDSSSFLQSVLENPENHHIKDTYFPHLTTKS